MPLKRNLLDCRTVAGYNVSMKVIIICERPDGWKWRIEPQDGTEAGGVDIVYKEDDDTKETRTCIGTLTDAEALADAILAYVEFTKKYHE